MNAPAAQMSVYAADLVGEQLVHVPPRSLAALSPIVYSRHYTPLRSVPLCIIALLIAVHIRELYLRKRRLDFSFVALINLQLFESCQISAWYPPRLSAMLIEFHGRSTFLDASL